MNVKSKFWGKSLEALPLGVNNVKLMTADGPELYSWRKVTTCVSNLILGTLTIDHYGDLEVKNHATGELCTVTFQPRDAGGWFGASANPIPFGKLMGIVRDSKGGVKFEISGGWNNQIQIIPKSKSRFVSPLTIWKASRRPPSSDKNFHFTDLSLFLNQLSDDLQVKLPPTDSRLRPDQRAMEAGLWDQADNLKNQIEVSQRARRKIIVSDFEKSNIPYGPTRRGLEFGEKWWQPRWFYREHDSITGEECWKFSGEYWKFREIGWPNYVNDIFQID